MVYLLLGIMGAVSLLIIGHAFDDVDWQGTCGVAFPDHPWANLEGYHLGL